MTALYMLRCLAFTMPVEALGALPVQLFRPVDVIEDFTQLFLATCKRYIRVEVDWQERVIRRYKFLEIFRLQVVHLSMVN